MSQGTTKMLRVVGCSNSSYWYAGRIGQVFKIFGYDREAGEFITREPSGYINIIKVADAELVDVTPSAPAIGDPGVQKVPCRSESRNWTECGYEYF